MRANRTTSNVFGHSKISRLPDQGTTIFSGMSPSKRFGPVSSLPSLSDRSSSNRSSSSIASLIIGSRRSKVPIVPNVQPLRFVQTSDLTPFKLPVLDLRHLSRFRNCENMISIAAVEEITYRQSRLCRLLGNPVAFAVVALLTNGKDLSTSEIAKAIGRSVPRTSNILGALRLAELVRYETEGRYARYRLKHPRQIRRILEALTEFVRTTSVAQR